MRLGHFSRVCGTNSMYAAGCRCAPCTAAHAAHHREYMNRPGNRDTERAKRFAVRDRVAAMKMAAGCVDCGYAEHDVALDYDHLPGATKLFSISGAWGRPWQSILDEIAKCEVVCANCHRVRTVGRRRGWD